MEEKAYRAVVEQLSGFNNLAFSNLFLSTLVDGYQKRWLHIGPILDVLRRVNENPGLLITRDNLFKYKPLRGLSKVHFTQPAFIPTMLRKYWEQNDRITTLYSQLSEKYSEQEFDAHFAHELTIGAFEKKKRRTGEWIVFKYLAGKAMVACFASHDENDEDISRRTLSVLHGDHKYFGLPWRDFDFPNQLKEANKKILNILEKK